MSAKRKILHLIPGLHIGGAEKLLLNTIELFPEFDHHVITFSASSQMLQNFEKLSIVHLKQSKKVFSLSNLLYLIRIEKEVQPFVIHSHLIKMNWLSRIAFQKKKNLINSIHSPYGKDAFSHNTYSLWVERFTYQKSNVVLVFVSDYVKADYNRFIPLTRKNFIVLNFVTDEYFNINPLKYISGTSLKLVAVGNIKPLKNYNLLIEAFKQLRHLPITLDIYGEGNLTNSYKQKVREHSLKIDFKGPVQKIFNVLGNYHALIFPSLYEGFSIALLEAMSAGLPLILSDIPMFKILTKSKANFFDPKNADNCVATILHAFHDGFDEESISSNKEYALEKFTAKAYKTLLNGIYHNLIGQEHLVANV